MPANPKGDPVYENRFRNCPISGGRDLSYFRPERLSELHSPSPAERWKQIAVYDHRRNLRRGDGWFPTLGDNDLCINVSLAADGFTIVDELDRFQLKKVQQVSIRGFGRRVGPGVLGQPLLVAQTFEMNKVPSQTQLAQVPVDEIWF